MPNQQLYQATQQYQKARSQQRRKQAMSNIHTAHTLTTALAKSLNKT